jgi:transposase InsO family protein
VALRGSGLNQVKVLHRPRLLSDNGPSYVSSELGKWLEDNGISYIRGRPFFGRNRVGQDAPHPLRRDKSRPVDSTAAGRGAAAIPSCPGSHIRALRARCKEGRGGLRDQASR